MGSDLFDSDWNFDAKESDVELVVTAEGPERVLGGGDAFELDAEVGDLSPVIRVGLEGEETSGGVDREENLVRLHLGPGFIQSQEEFFALASQLTAFDTCGFNFDV